MWLINHWLFLILLLIIVLPFLGAINYYLVSGRISTLKPYPLAGQALSKCGGRINRIKS